MNKKCVNRIFNPILAGSYIIVAFTLFSYASNAQTKKEMDDHRLKWGVTAAAEEVKNPISENIAYTDTGKVLYKKACAVCHGDKGKGDGVAAAGLAVKPADHTSAMVQAQTDGALFYEVSNGHAPMPGFKTVFTERQRWALVDYLRTLSKNKPEVAKAKSAAKESVQKNETK